MRKKLTNIEFIEKCIKIHGNKYDYSLVEYIHSKYKVKIICKKHGIFEQTPNHHIKGQGCAECYNDKRNTVKLLTKYDFINRSSLIHNNKYNYSLINYNGTHNKVKIICKKHGIFEQKADDHLKGTGCPLCYGTIQKTTTQFIKESKEIHGNKYDYSLVDYINNTTKVKIICKKHGVFEQKPIHHINNSCGCSMCNESKGEEEIKNILIKNKINFEQQKTYEDCKKERVLPFDFYLPDFNILIEYDGIQHYKSVLFFGGDEKFLMNKNRDKIKNRYCEDNNINLLRIKYDENIIKKLESYIEKIT